MLPVAAEKPRIINCIDAKLIENEVPEIVNVENMTEAVCTFLYYELYHNQKGYEVHIMADMNMDLKYITIQCEDVVLGEDKKEAMDELKHS